MRSSRRHGGLLWGALAVAAVAALAVGCGGDDGDDGGGGGDVSAADYVNDVCASLSDLGSAIEEGQGELQGALTTPEEGRRVIIDFLDGAAASAEGALSSIEGAGVPDVEDGQQAADAIAAAIDETQRTFEDARSEAEDISTGSEAAFATDAQEIAGAIEESSEQIQESLTEVGDHEELADAAEDADACQELS